MVTTLFATQSKSIMLQALSELKQSRFTLIDVNSSFHNILYYLSLFRTNNSLTIKNPKAYTR
jgi:hypothetical protein